MLKKFSLLNFARAPTVRTYETQTVTLMTHINRIMRAKLQHLWSEQNLQHLQCYKNGLPVYSHIDVDNSMVRRVSLHLNDSEETIGAERDVTDVELRLYFLPIVQSRGPHEPTHVGTWRFSFRAFEEAGIVRFADIVVDRMINMLFRMDPDALPEPLRAQKL